MFYEERTGTGTFTKEDADLIFNTDKICEGKGLVHVKAPTYDVVKTTLRTGGGSGSEPVALGIGNFFGAVLAKADFS